MRVLFQSVCVITPHFDTELELMKEHLIKGDEVYVLHCKEDLKTCLVNFNHSKWYCYKCQKRFEHGVKLLGDKVNIIRYPFENKGEYDNIPACFENIEQLKKFKLGNAELGICTASNLISELNREPQLNTITNKEIISREINNAYFVYLSFKEVLTTIKPDLVYLFNGRFSTVLPALNACEELRIAYKTHERGGSKGRYDLYDNTIPHDLDNINREINASRYIVPESQYKSEGKRFFEDRRKRIEHSWMSFTKQQQYGVLPNDFDPAKKTIIFYNTTIEEYAAIRCWPKPIRIYDDEIDAICSIVESFSPVSRYQFYLRVHPNLTGYENSQVQRIKSLENKYSHLTVIPANSNIDSYTLMEQSDIIIIFGSTMGVEACYWGKPSILLGMALYQGLDCCYIPETHEEVINLLTKELLPPKSTDGALLYGNWELNRGFQFKHFHQTGLFSGTFDGKTVKFTLFKKLGIFMMFILESYFIPSKIYKIYTKSNS